MSLLTNSLNQIKTWLEKNCPQAAENITPGLNVAEIESKIQYLPFSLPDEFYELYQWSRGNDLITPTIYEDIFGADDGMGLNTLEYAMQLFPDFIDEEFEECAANYIGKPLFPTFGTDKTFLCIVGDWQEKTPSPIVYVSELRETEHRYFFHSVTHPTNYSQLPITHYQFPIPNPQIKLTQLRHNLIF
ncbi:hypothetical protein Riv7116_0319 [Rivularia sp. PCC 7116]|uniref:hypothetical protein n=1 Tax=Rivularia sp. PCC 7116 TaxID=373994 RepID=UPI00029EC62D|nr:hypothetical protein [Rivularia sp. PCC 7116]AFY52923.1 hypothetical protein Riv7116_0319 [Rivularia sp. PCC 7116]